MATCEQVISINGPIARTERRRGFQPPYYTVYVYRCPQCSAEHTMRKSWHGPTPNGGFVCNTRKDA